MQGSKWKVFMPDVIFSRRCPANCQDESSLSHRPPGLSHQALRECLSSKSQMLSTRQLYCCCSKQNRILNLSREAASIQDNGHRGMRPLPRGMLDLIHYPRLISIRVRMLNHSRVAGKCQLQSSHHNTWHHKDFSSVESSKWHDCSVP